MPNRLMIHDPVAPGRPGSDHLEIVAARQCAGDLFGQIFGKDFHLLITRAMRQWEHGDERDAPFAIRRRRRARGWRSFSVCDSAPSHPAPHIIEECIPRVVVH